MYSDWRLTVPLADHRRRHRGRGHFNTVVNAQQPSSSLLLRRIGGGGGRRCHCCQQGRSEYELVQQRPSSMLESNQQYKPWWFNLSTWAGIRRPFLLAYPVKERLDPFGHKRRRLIYIAKSAQYLRPPCRFGSRQGGRWSGVGLTTFRLVQAA
jgi:hypothetical protein